MNVEFVAIADYMPSDKEDDSIRLMEGQVVEVVDREKSDVWLVKTRPSKLIPPIEGWVPSAYLEEKAVASQLVVRDDREKFREEVLKVNNKKQEAILKRRWVQAISKAQCLLWRLIMLFCCVEEVRLMVLVETSFSVMYNKSGCYNLTLVVIFGDIFHFKCSMSYLLCKVRYLF